MNASNVKLLVIGGILVLTIFVIWFFNGRNNKNNSNENFPTENLAYTEEEAQSFYSKKIIKYIDTFKGSFFMSYLVENTDKNGKVTSYNEEYSVDRDSGAISIYEVDSFQRILIKGQTMYYVDINNKTVTVVDSGTELQQYVDDQFGKMLFTSLNDVNRAFSTMGNEEVNGVNFYFEEYNITDSTATKVRYYFDDNDNIKYMKIFYDNGIVSLLTVNTIDTQIHDSSFTIPDDYTFITQNS
ncbi:MAG: hypothetical protein FWF46_02995 [Oscillospiraceae bacterium]|nr:hypothetical protein [Oscillospiraceae bacterium]